MQILDSTFERARIDRNSCAHREFKGATPYAEDRMFSRHRWDRRRSFFSRIQAHSATLKSVRPDHPRHVDSMLPLTPNEIGTVIRMFPDYADSVIWFLGPVPYGDVRISQRLAEDLFAWEDRFYAILDDQQWIRDEYREAFDAEGFHLARRLSDELGAPFAVDYISEKGHVTRFASALPGTNPDAVTAFTVMVEEIETRSKIWDGLLSSGVELHVVQTGRHVPREPGSEAGDGHSR